MVGKDHINQHLQQEKKKEKPCFVNQLNIASVDYPGR
jgi:hypothetical protein